MAMLFDMTEGKYCFLRALCISIFLFSLTNITDLKFSQVEMNPTLPQAMCVTVKLLVVFFSNKCQKLILSNVYERSATASVV
jgi:hypothetical protein